MSKIAYKDFMRMMMYDVIKNYSCIEVEFCVDNDKTYDACWLGKTISRDNNEAVFWFGLVKDGSQAYEFSSLEQFLNTKVFGKNSLKGIWNLITLFSIDGCNVEERLSFYLGIEDFIM